MAEDIVEYASGPSATSNAGACEVAVNGFVFGRNLANSSGSVVSPSVGFARILGTKLSRLHLRHLHRIPRLNRKTWPTLFATCGPLFFFQIKSYPPKLGRPPTRRLDCRRLDPLSKLKTSEKRPDKVADTSFVIADTPEGNVLSEDIVEYPSGPTAAVWTRYPN